MTDREFETLLDENRGLLKWAANRVFYNRFTEHRKRGVTFDDLYSAALYGLWRASLRWTGEGCWRAYLCTALYRTVTRYSVRALRHVNTVPAFFDDSADETEGLTVTDPEPVELPERLLDLLKPNQGRCLRLWHYDVEMLPDEGTLERRRIFVVASQARANLRTLGRERVSELLGVT